MKRNFRLSCDDSVLEFCLALETGEISFRHQGDERFAGLSMLEHGFELMRIAKGNMLFRHLPIARRKGDEQARFVPVALDRIRLTTGLLELFVEQAAPGGETVDGYHFRYGVRFHGADGPETVGFAGSIAVDDDADFALADIAATPWVSEALCHIREISADVD